MTLYELSDTYQHVLSTLVDGEIPEDLSGLIDCIEDDIHHKVEALCKVRQTIIAEAQGIEAESGRLAVPAGSRYRAADALKAYLQRCLERSGQTKIKTPLFTVWVQASPPNISWDGEATDAPPEFQRVTTTVAIDKSKAMDIHKAGGELPPGFTVSQATHLRIK